MIEATKEPDYFGFYSPELEGFTGVGHSVEDCIYQAKWGMIEHINLLKEKGLPIPPENKNPKIALSVVAPYAAFWAFSSIFTHTS